MIICRKIRQKYPAQGKRALGESAPADWYNPRRQKTKKCHLGWKVPDCPETWEDDDFNPLWDTTGQVTHNRNYTNFALTPSWEYGVREPGKNVLGESRPGRKKDKSLSRYNKIMALPQPIPTNETYRANPPSPNPFPHAAPLQLLLVYQNIVYN